MVADPKGRAVFVAAADKHKICWIMNRDSAGKITINSPLEANKASVLTMALAALDVGYENPVFAAIEVDYSDIDQMEHGIDDMEKVRKILSDE